MLETYASSAVGLISPTHGGTGLTSYTTGDILYASATNVLSKLADVAVGSYLRSGGVATAPVWSTATLPNTAASGDIIYASATNVYSNLAKGSDGQVLKLASGIPSWASVASGLTGTTGDLISFSATNTAAAISAVATGSILASAGTSTLPVWSASPSLTTSLTVPLLIGGTTTTSDLFLKTTSGVGTTGADMHFLVGNNGATEAMTILNSGNVGIGTAAPVGLLHIYGLTSAKATIEGVGNSTNGFATLLFKTDAGSSAEILNYSTGAVSYGGASSLNINNYINAPITFMTNSAERIRILGSGNVGIGVTSPTALLHIKAGTATSSTAPYKETAGTLLSTIEALTHESNASSGYSSTVALNRYAEGGVIADFTSDVSNTSTSETDLYTYTTKANTLVATGEKVIFYVTGTFNDLTATSQLQFYFGGTNIGNTGALTVSATGGWTAQITVIRTGSTTARSTVNLSTPGASTAVYTTETDITGLTFSNTNIIKVTGTAAGASGGTGDITAKMGYIMWWGAANN